jgi:hypothetical protein
MASQEPPGDGVSLIPRQESDVPLFAKPLGQAFAKYLYCLLRCDLLRKFGIEPA